jgi:hypothetical protein
MNTRAQAQHELFGAVETMGFQRRRERSRRHRDVAVRFQQIVFEVVEDYHIAAREMAAPSRAWLRQALICGTLRRLCGFAVGILAICGEVDISAPMT